MASKYLQKYPVPEDFPDLLHDFAREVLRDQPENIYEYGALYFKAAYMVSSLHLFYLIFVTYRGYHSTTTRKEKKSHHQRTYSQTYLNTQRSSHLPTLMWFRMLQRANIKWLRKSISNNNTWSNTLTSNNNKRPRSNSKNRTNRDSLRSSSMLVPTSMT